MPRIQLLKRQLLGAYTLGLDTVEIKKKMVEEIIQTKNAS